MKDKLESVAALIEREKFIYEQIGIYRRTFLFDRSLSADEREYCLSQIKMLHDQLIELLREQ